MKLVVFSDSHGSDSEMLTVLNKRHPNADYVIHLGDGKDETERLSMQFPRTAFVTVYGNCDSGAYAASRAELERTLDLGCVRIFLCHGHTLGVAQGLERLCCRARSVEADMALYGHTHCSFYSEITACSDDGHKLYVVNPGSISSPRGGVLGGRSYAVINVTDSGEIAIRLEPFDI